jgi:predicted  nucleic acid-binding Zn-ribbon protein
MNMNPITALSDLLGKLVVEHGSAVITEKNLAFLRDQLMTAEKEITTLTDRLEESETQNNALKTENEALRNENINLKQHITGIENNSDPPGDPCPYCRQPKGQLTELKPHPITGTWASR